MLNGHWCIDDFDYKIRCFCVRGEDHHEDFWDIPVED